MTLRFRASLRIAPGIRAEPRPAGAVQLPPQHPPRAGRLDEYRQARPVHLGRTTRRARHGRPQNQGDGQRARRRPGCHRRRLGRAAAQRCRHDGAAVLVGGRMAVGRIVRTTYRYKRPPGKRKPVALEVPTVVAAKSSRRLIGEKAAAEAQLAPVSRRRRLVQPSTPCQEARVAHPDNTARQPAVLTIRRQPAKSLPPGLLPDTRRRRPTGEPMPPMRCGAS
jgi:hypothetical protein